jgi:hypothetical protein
MPITGSQKALMFARSGLARSGATRSGYFNENVALTIGGVDRAGNIWKGSWEIYKQLGSAQLAMTVFGIEPEEGEEVIFGTGAINHREFGGTIAGRTQLYSPGLTLWKIDCVDWMRQFRKVLVSKRYTSQAAHLIILDLVSMGPGFTTNAVVTSSPTIDAIDFTEEPRDQAFARVVARCPGYRGYIDAYRDVHFALTETVQNPNPIEDTNYTNQGFTYTEDGTQRITQAVVEGGGGRTTAPVAAGATVIPVDECAWYSASGGTVKSGPQRITYTGRSASSGPGNITGVPGSGAGSIVYDLTQGQDVNLLAIVNDLVAQAAIIVKEGGDGVYARFYSDRRLSLAGATQLATSRLLGTPPKSGHLVSLDRFADVGRTLTLNHTARGLSFESTITTCKLSSAAQDRIQREITYSTGFKLDVTDAVRSIAGIEKGVSG